MSIEWLSAVRTAIVPFLQPQLNTRFAKLVSALQHLLARFHDGFQVLQANGTQDFLFVEGLALIP